MSEQRLSVATTFTDDPDAGLTPIDTAELTGAVWSTFASGAVRWKGGPSPVRFYFRPQETHRIEFDDTAIGARVDVLKGDHLARRLDIWWLAGSSPTDRGTGWEASHEDPELIAQFGEGEGWVMRVTGDAAVALRAGEAGRYWSGEFWIPLRIHEREDDAPQRHWWSQE